MPFAGLQILEGENRHEVIGTFMRAAETVGSKFKVLKFLGLMDLGRAQFLRFETDCNRAYVIKAAWEMHRGHIVSISDGKYIATFGAWKGPVSAAGMQEIARPGFRKTYRGPGAPFWERQFKKVCDD